MFRVSAPPQIKAVLFRRLPLIALALAVVAGFAAGAANVAAQTPDPAMARPIVFYLAHGEANACGPGCSEWIAAEGKIEGGAVGRLQHLLARLSKPLPPLFMNSPGGQVNGSIDLGRLVRARRLTVTVGHTVPLDCDRDPLSAKSCAAQISAGQTIEARLDPTTTMCNSGCVYVLAGGSTRLIPPWTSLGIHEVGYIPTAGRPEPTKLAIMVGKQIADDHLRAYIREMGIDQRLLTEAFAVPFSSVARLSREDAVRFGLDRREFAETPWQFFDKPVLAIRKGFFVRTDDSKARYVNGVVSVFCGRGSDNHSVLTFGREHLSTDPADIAGQPPLSLSVNGRDISLPRVPNDKLLMRQATLPMTAVDTMVDTATLVVPGSELGRQQGAAGQQGSGQQSTGDITFNMLGFSQARAKLQEACLHPSAVIAVRTTGIGLAALTMPMPLQSLQAGALEPGATRAQVDAKLGAPTQTIGSVSLYSYTSTSNERKVMAGYFKADRLLHFARFVLKDGKIIDEINNTELNEGLELSAIRLLLTSPVTASRPAAPWPAAVSSH